MKIGFLRFVESEEGATAIEYGMIASLISIAAIGAFSLLGGDLTLTFGSVASQLADAAPQRSQLAPAPQNCFWTGPPMNISICS
jgi:pilus assembly protein Flp/PilA